MDLFVFAYLFEGAPASSHRGDPVPLRRLPDEVQDPQHVQASPAYSSRQGARVRRSPHDAPRTVSSRPDETVPSRRPDHARRYPRDFVDGAR